MSGTCRECCVQLDEVGDLCDACMGKPRGRPDRDPTTPIKFTWDDGDPTTHPEVPGDPKAYYYKGDEISREVYYQLEEDGRLRESAGELESPEIPATKTPSQVLMDRVSRLEQDNQRHFMSIAKLLSPAPGCPECGPPITLNAHGGCDSCTYEDPVPPTFHDDIRMLEAILARGSTDDEWTEQRWSQFRAYIDRMKGRL